VAQQRSGGRLPERNAALIAALAHDAGLAVLQIEVAQLQADHFRDPRARVEHEQQHGVVAGAVGGVRAGGVQKLLHFIGREGPHLGLGHRRGPVLVAIESGVRFLSRISPP
jgi:hypothetical protein